MNKISSFLWDTWCIVSIIGIWPRFIEPNIITTKRITLPITNLPKKLSGFSLLHISDLHFSDNTSDLILHKIIDKVQRLKPDAIAFTGDLLCYGELVDQERLLKFLSSLKAPFGVYATLGNHDYEQYLSLDNQGRFIIAHDRISPIVRGFSKLLGFTLERQTEPVTKPISPLASLVSLYKQAGITLLHNENALIGFGSSRINLVGLGDLMAEQCLPEHAFKGISSIHPTIVLSHNPDSYPLLKQYPGDLYLFGHTHGGQVNLPFFWEKITPLLDKSLKSGLHARDNKILYISRGLGSTLPFRWFAPPQMTLFQFVPSQKIAEPVWKPLQAISKALSPQISPQTQCPTRSKTVTD